MEGPAQVYTVYEEVGQGLEQIKKLSSGASQFCQQMREEERGRWLRAFQGREGKRK
jgi:hypothetical protein